MSYQSPRQHNTRNSNRFNRPGSFVPPSSSNHQTYEVPAPPLPRAVEPPAPREPEPQPQPDPWREEAPMKQEDVEMESAALEDESSPSNSRQSFFKTKLIGIKKISNKERRRRQNALLRRLTSPKNALMCINEMLPNEQVTNQFKVEATPPEGFLHSMHNFCAELVLDGVTYKGFGETKLAARNAAAEQAIRDIVLRKMARYSELIAQAAASDPAGNSQAAGDTASNNQAAADDTPGASTGSAAEAAVEAALEADGTDALPMIQLLSFALHKLFAEWEGAGHHVPQLRARQPSQQVSEEERLPLKPPQPRMPKQPKVPDNASAMHPAMLLTVLRPHAAYRELAAEGDKPQNMIFTIAVDVDEKTYIGKAPNKREARKRAARAACKDILNITFDDERLVHN